MRSAYVARRRVVNAYLVRERDRRRWRELGWVLATTLPLGLALLAYTWLQVEVLATGYRIETLERRVHQLAQTERELRLEAAYLTSPARLGERARAELGLQPPALEQLVFAREWQ